MSRTVPLRSPACSMLAKIFFTAKYSTYAGKSLAAKTPPTPRIASTMIRPCSETPRCFPMNPPWHFILVLSLDAVADALEVAEVHPHQEGASLDVVVRHESPVTAVAALVAVVAHHEIVPRGDHAAKTVVIGFAILSIGELADLRKVHRRLRRNDHHLVVVLPELFHERRQPQVVQLRVGVKAPALRRHRLPCDDEALF